MQSGLPLNFGLGRPWAENLAEPHCARTTDPWKLWDSKSVLLSLTKFVVVSSNSDKALTHHPSLFMIISSKTCGYQLKCHHVRGSGADHPTLNESPLATAIIFLLSPYCFLPLAPILLLAVLLIWLFFFNISPMRTRTFVQYCSSGTQKDDWSRVSIQ